MRVTEIEITMPYMENKPADFHDVTDRLKPLRWLHIIWDYEFFIHPLTKEGRMYFKVPTFLRKVAYSFMLGAPLKQKYLKNADIKDL